MGQFLWRARRPDREDSSEGRSRAESPVTVITMVHNKAPTKIAPPQQWSPTRPASPPRPQMMQPQLNLPVQQQTQKQKQQTQNFQPTGQVAAVRKSKSKQRTITTTREGVVVGEGIHKIEASPAPVPIPPGPAKTIDTASDIHEPTQNFVLLTNRKSVAMAGQARSPESEGSLLQPVDAISASKSTSGGTRRVYKVMRVAPSKFLTKKEQQAAAEAAAARATGGGGGTGHSNSKGNKEA